MNDKDLVASTYNAAADYFDAKPLSFWDSTGRRTVERLKLKPGASVLDVCCGSGASAMPAARAVGPGGRVVGVDLSENLLGLARAKAGQQGLAHVELLRGDFEALDPSAETFDAVICVFGIFFVSDMSCAVRHLWRMLRPGGQLAITTWGPRVLEPGSTAFWDSVRKERPDLYKGFNPWDRITEAASLRAMLLEGGVRADNIEAESGEQKLDAVQDWWTIALGMGYRGTIEQLTPEVRARVRQSNLELLRKANVKSVETNALYAIARKSSLHGCAGD